MKIEVLEGFDQYSSAESAVEGGVQSQYPGSGGGAVLSPGLSGRGQSLRMHAQGGGGGSVIRFPIAVPDLQVTTAFAFEIIAGIQVGAAPFTWLGAAGNTQFAFIFAATGRLNLINSAGAVLASSSHIFVPGQIYRCCVSVVMDNNVGKTGTLGMTVNGEVDANFGGSFVLQSQATAPIGFFQCSPCAGGAALADTHYIDDIIIASGVATDWGPMELWTGLPTVDVVNQWTRSTGADNFANVDDATFDVDATYNSSDTAGQKDIFDFANLPVTSESILAIGLAVFAKKEESADKTYRSVLRIAGVDHNGADIHANEVYTNQLTYYTQNPATVAAFTPADINALQAGYEFRS